VGQDAHKIVNQIQDVAPIESNQVFTAHSADLSTVAGSRQLVTALEEAETQPAV